MLVVIDNYDSFTYNLVQYLGELGAAVTVFRNDAIGPEEVIGLAPQAIVISPGPGTPAQAGITVPLVRLAGGTVPVLGVCLGHQAIGEAFGGRVIRAQRQLHGKTSPIAHDGDDLFRDLDSPFDAMRYHSLVVDPSSLPPALRVTAWAADRPRGAEIMGLRHRDHLVFGVQFHPESVGTEAGKPLLDNFLRITRSGS